ncbi:hypothetical protein Zm00014a_000112 [Zea mays]|uniref:Uncharacterized protein n=1 Tax=Zea mays TaxID=4577 RepID=A0A3L6DN05_MAIZE|nr:hypothetical protein Zm00014a_000112 [Zea mays]
MDKQEHPESSQDPPPELFEPLTMKKIPAPSLEVKKKLQAPRQHRRPLRSYKSQSLEEEFDPFAISVAARRSHQHQLPLTHPGDVSD